MNIRPATTEDDIARQFGYRAMQFNIVVSTVGRLPKAFRHPRHGYVDAFVMYKWLEPRPLG